MTKKLKISSYITLGAALVALIAFIIYLANVGGAGYFHGNGASGIVVCSIFAIICLIGGVFLPFIPNKDNVVIGKTLQISAGVLRIVGAVLLIIALMVFIMIRAEGFAYIFFSNADVSAEVQTPANLASAKTAITGIIFYGVSWLVAVVASFFR